MSAKKIDRSQWPGQRSKKTPANKVSQPKTHFFVLGRQPFLSLAELASVLFHYDVETRQVEFSDSVALVESPRDIDSSQVLNTLGGVLKAGRIIGELSVPSAENIYDLLQQNGFVTALAQHERQVTLAISLYVTGNVPDFSRRDKADFVEQISKTLKSKLREQEISCRYLTWQGSPEGKPITTAQLLRAKALEFGLEICLVRKPDRLLVGVTEAIQDLEAFAKRDIQKPYRRTEQGLLPPKLARILVNLARAPNDCVLLDPFCGSGVVLMEALQLGLNVVGNDSAPDALQATQANVQWLYQNQQDLPDLSKNRFLLQDARKLVGRIEPLSVDCIATEPYLGPPLKEPASPLEAARILKMLKPLYLETLAELRILLKPGGRLAMVFPRIASKNKGFGLDLTREIELMGYRTRDPLEPMGLPNAPSSLIYARQGQRVQRQVCILENPH